MSTRGTGSHTCHARSGEAPQERAERRRVEGGAQGLRLERPERVEEAALAFGELG